jgi:hypothetical protein
MHEEQKNVDQNIQQCRDSIFGLLGAGFALKCQLSPTSLENVATQ